MSKFSVKTESLSNEVQAFRSMVSILNNNKSSLNNIRQNLSLSGTAGNKFIKRGDCYEKNI